MELSEIENFIPHLDNLNEIYEVINNLRRIASYTKTNQIVTIIDNLIEKISSLKINKAIVYLLDLKIKQIYYKASNLPQVSKLFQIMLTKSQEIEDDDCLSLTYQIKWYIDKLKNDELESMKAIESAFNLINSKSVKDKYTIFMGKYKWALSQWLDKHDENIIDLFEECANYFLENGYYRGFTQSIFFISIIYGTAHNSKKLLEISKRIFLNRTFFDKLPENSKAFVNYLTGLGHMINFNIKISESYLKEAYNILQPTYKNSIYFSNFLILHSHIATLTVLQGKTTEAFEMVVDEINLLNEEFYQKNLDKATKKQIEHTLNLNRFYIYSRLKNYTAQKWQNLIDKIFEGSKILYSNFMLLSEFIINADLQLEQLLELLSIENFSLNRAKHIIMYQLEKIKDIPDTHELCIDILSSRTRTKETTFIEDAFADLLIAQELYALERFDDISSILSKYKNKLHRIEVVELRLFMEAFIQVGEFRKGDPLAPALQYMAIKRCRERNFSRLEQRIETYQQTMKEWALTRITS